MKCLSRIPNLVLVEYIVGHSHLLSLDEEKRGELKPRLAMSNDVGPNTLPLLLRDNAPWVLLEVLARVPKSIPVDAALQMLSTGSVEVCILLTKTHYIRNRRDSKSKATCYRYHTWSICWARLLPSFSKPTSLGIHQLSSILTVSLHSRDLYIKLVDLYLDYFKQSVSYQEAMVDMKLLSGKFCGDSFVKSPEILQRNKSLPKGGTSWPLPFRLFTSI